MNWLHPYNNEFQTEEDLINIISKINRQVNLEINQTTNMPPIALFEREKEHLEPLPNKQVILQYLDTMIPFKVPDTLLVYYKGSQYSVPQKYINKTVKLKEVDNQLHIYYNKDLIISHQISDKKINYDINHYQEALQNIMPYKDFNEIQQMAQNNLDLLDKLNK